MKLRMFAIAAATLAFAACETAEGYRQQMSMWQGRMGDDLMIQWGAPQNRGTLSDGRQVWTYNKSTVERQEAYYRDEQRQVTRKFVDKDGKEKTETITETFPVLQPAQTYTRVCTTRFVLSSQQRIQEVTFEGEGCVAPES
jgi:hypothetical protein